MNKSCEKVCGIIFFNIIHLMGMLLAHVNIEIAFLSKLRIADFTNEFRSGFQMLLRDV